MKVTSVVMVACAVLAATSGVARADLVLVGGTPSTSFANLGAQGFGNDPRLLTLQTAPIETGSVTPLNTVHGDAISGADKSSTPTIGSLGWTSGATVGIGFNDGQSGQTGVTIQSLTLTIYAANQTTVLGTFSIAGPVQFSAADLALQQGNGNGVFDFGLNAAQQGTFNNILAMSGSSGFYAGLAASVGCGGTPSSTCQVANDGPDTFIGFAQTNATVPDGGTTVMLLGGALLGIESLRRKFRV